MATRRFGNRPRKGFGEGLPKARSTDADRLPGAVRIIAGQWRRRQLPVLQRTGLRPTPDRVRETLFSWLANDLNGASCVDLFSGTGALGIEAASRGARKVILVERDPQLAAHLRAQVQALQACMVEVVCADALLWFERAGECFDVVFVDPPYGSVDLPALMNSLWRHGCVNSNSRVYAEVDANHDGAVFPDSWSLFRHKRAGRVRYYLAIPAPP